MMFFVFQVSRKLRVGVPIEEHAEFVYTRVMFEKFYDELFESGKFAIHQVHEGQKYVLVRNKDRMLDCPKKMVVIYANDRDISCECGLFEHMGMLCRHILKVGGHLCSLVSCSFVHWCCNFYTIHYLLCLFSID